MFCFQCEQTAGCKACAGNVGVCGKKADTAELQDKLTGALIGLARATEGNEHVVSDSTATVVVEGLFATLTNVNFDNDAILAIMDRVELEKQKLVPSDKEYEEKIKAAKEGAFRQFREDFISKIKSRIQDLKSQIGMLNSSLRGFTFGRDRYRFEVSANPDYKQYYDMFMDPLLLDVQGGNLYSEAFFDKYRMEVEDLFSCLIVNDKEKASAERMAQYERDLARYTDYRTYLIFDLIVIDTESGAEQRLSKTLLKKSGGETQLPFYIALLASFSQVCRIRQHQDNTVRLVIFDEAFSKMDAERIRESIKLLRQFGLQAIFSAPSDKIKDIAPFVDEVIVAYRDSRHSFTRCYTPGELTEKDA